MSELGLTLRGVANLWLPFALGGLHLLRPGGAFALVLPSELFCTQSAGVFRATVVDRCEAIRVDLFPRDTFPDILQDIVVVSGRWTGARVGRRAVMFAEHRADEIVEWRHCVPATADAWLRYLLTHEEFDAFQQAAALPGIVSLGDVARLEVSTVTGANPFFTVNDDTLRQYDLSPWARPLLARTADCPGLVFTRADHEQARCAGRPVWLLDFAADRPDPRRRRGPHAYLELGERQSLPARYKCRIRDPWYRVPHIRAGELLLSKRAHRGHRLLLNTADALTTDTIYRGPICGPARGRSADLVAGFQNTLTLLSTEIEGRTYGGGVLELVPSEIARLRVPLVPLAERLKEFDALSRQSGGQRDPADRVAQAVDNALTHLIPGYGDLLPRLRAARRQLLHRRLDRHVDQNVDQHVDQLLDQQLDQQLDQHPHCGTGL